MGVRVYGLGFGVRGLGCQVFGFLEGFPNLGIYRGYTEGLYGVTYVTDSVMYSYLQYCFTVQVLGS